MRPCPFCGEATVARELTAAGARYAVCAACGGARTFDLPRAEEYYAEYRVDAGSGRALEMNRRRYDSILARLERECPERSLLEVGCGSGAFLAAAAEQGWDAVGTELSAAAADRGRREGLCVVEGDLASDDLLEGRRFGAVVMIEVLEHLERPVHMLRRAGEHLLPGGSAYLTTPNVDSLSRRVLGGRWSVFDAEHVSLASPRALRVALTRAGFRVRSVRSRNVNPGELRMALRRGPGRMDARARHAAGDSVRGWIDRRAILRGAKAAANVVLGATGTGDTLVARAEWTAPHAGSPSSPGEG